MPVFNLRCFRCDVTESVMAKRRPLPPPKCMVCGGLRDFVVNVSTKVVEVLDTGLQPTQVTQIDGVKQLLKDRARQAEREDPTPIKLGK